MTLQVVMLTYTGTTRERNEDRLVLPGFVSAGSWSEPINHSQADSGIFAVVDGMGGHRSGDTASRVAGECFATAPLGDIVETVRLANRSLYEEAEQHPERKGMGATVAGVALRGGTGVAFNVGDARVYQFSGSYLMLLSTDDRATHDSHAVTQSLGGADHFTDVAVHVRDFALERGDRLLLCSDGLSEALPFAEIQDLLAHPSLNETGLCMRDAIFNRVTDDNVTFILIQSGDTR